MPRLTHPLARPARRATHALAIAALMLAPGAGQANPQGPVVVHGSATFAAPDAATLNITNAPGTVINWAQFGISAGEVTRFLQQGAHSAVLNRVVGGDPSAILGSLLSNGRVFLINPNGVLFGAGAVVDTAGLVVSTLDMKDADFIAGRLKFAGTGAEGGLVNRGTVRSAGSVVLVAPRIENSGLIETDGGGLLLAAGREVTVTSLENPEIGYLLRAPENEAVNLGTLVARGGAAQVFAGSIRHSGEIDASALTVDAQGRVRLVAQSDLALGQGSTVTADGAGAGGSVHVQSLEGNLTAESATLSAAGAAGAGGEVALLGREVALKGAVSVDASGAAGGGTVLVGGDYQGANPEVPNARRTTVSTATRIAADATGEGDGGKVVVWSDGTTAAGGTISARGGPAGGDGGLVEVSGKGALGFVAHVDTRAPKGSPGTLLLDPVNVIAALGGLAPLPAVDQAGDPSVGPGCDGTTCTVDTAVINGAMSPVVLQATDTVTINNAISMQPGISFTAQANNDVIVNAPVTTQNAAITLQANQANAGGPSGTGSVVINNALTSNGGFVDVFAGDAIDMSGGGSISAGAGNVNLTVAGGAQAGDITVTSIASTGDVRIVNQNVNAGSDIRQSGAGSIAGTRVLLEVEFTSGTIGTPVNPVRIADGARVEAHGHSPNIVPIFIQGLGDLTVGDGGSGVVKGVQSTGGAISVSAAGILTLLAPGGGLSGPVQSGGGAGDDITLTAGNGININASVDADTEAVTLDAGAGAITQGAGGGISAGALKATAATGIALDAASNSVAQFTADNNTAGDIKFHNSGGALELTDNGTAFAVRNNGGGQVIIANDESDITINHTVIATGAGNIDIGTVQTDAGASVTVNSPVTQLGTGDIILRAEGSDRRVTVNAQVEAMGGSVVVSADDQTINAGLLAAADVSQHPQNAIGVLLGAVGDATPGALELSDSELNLVFAPRLFIGDFALGTQNITVSAPVILFRPALMELFLNSNANDIIVNAALSGAGKQMTFEARGGGIIGNGGGGGVITADTLNLLGASAVPLNKDTNAIGGLSASGIGAGGIDVLNNSGAVALALNNVSALGAVTIANTGNVSHLGTVQSTVIGDVILSAASTYTMGAAGVARAALGNVTVSATTGIALGLLDAPSGSATASTAAGPITDAIGAAVNVTALDAAFSAGAGIGTIGDPIETMVPAYDTVSTTTGDIALSNTGNLQTSLSVPVSTGGGRIQLQSTGSLTTRNDVTATSLVTLTASNVLRTEKLVRGNDMVLTSTTADVFAEGTLQATATGLAPNTPVITINAPGSFGDVDVNQPLMVASGAVRITADADIDLDGNDNDTTHILPGLLDVNSANGRIMNGGSAVITAHSVLLRAMDEVNLASITTTGGGIDIASTTDRVVINNFSGPTEQLSSATDVIVSAPMGNFEMGDGGITANNLTVTVGGNMFRAGSFPTPVNTQVNTLTLTGAGGTIGISNTGNLGLNTVSNAGGTLDLITSGAFTDANAAGVNLVASMANLSAGTGIGSVTDPLESQLVNLGAASTSSGPVGIANNGPLTLLNDITTMAGGDILLTGTGGLDVSSRIISGGGQVALGGGSGVLLVNNSSVNAATTLTASAADIDLYSSFLNATDMSFIATNSLHLQAGSGQPVNVDASNNVSVTAGSLIIEGGASFGDSAALKGGNVLTVNAGTVTVKGGAGNSAPAQIDPVSVIINAASDVLVQAGTGTNSHAEIFADALVAVTSAGGNVDVVASDVSRARIDAVLGNVTINAPAGNVSLFPGSNPAADGDAYIAANNGAGTVAITALSCSGCVELGVNPFRTMMPEAGIFGLLTFIQAAAPPPLAPPPPPPATGGGSSESSVDLSAEEVLVLRDLAENLLGWTFGDGAGDDDEEGRLGQCR